MFSAASRRPDRVSFDSDNPAGWHLYSLTTPDGGPIPTTAVLKAETLQNTAVYEPAPERRFDPSFNLDTETFSGQVVLLICGTVPMGAQGDRM